MDLLTITDQDRLRVDTLHADHREMSVNDIVRQGLTREAKYLSPILFYDQEGSRLFEKICDLPEYYLTRTEQSILDAHVAAMIGSAAFFEPLILTSPFNGFSPSMINLSILNQL